MPCGGDRLSDDDIADLLEAERVELRHLAIRLLGTTAAPRGGSEGAFPLTLTDDEVIACLAERSPTTRRVLRLARAPALDRLRSDYAFAIAIDVALSERGTVGADLERVPLGTIPALLRHPDDIADVLVAAIVEEPEALETLADSDDIDVANSALYLQYWFERYSPAGSRRPPQ